MRKSRYFFIPTLLILSLFTKFVHAQPVDIAPPAAERIAEIASMLVPVENVVHPVTDREFWDRAGEVPYLHNYIERANAVLDLQAPNQKEWVEAYLEYSKSGNRTIWQNMVAPLQESLRLYCIAELIENEGHFIPMIEQRIREFCKRPSWVLSAHDGDLRVLDGYIVRVDLRTASLGADLAVCLLALEERLDPEVKALLIRNLRERVLDPFRKEMTGEQEPNFWLTTTNNWNAVCLCGVSVVAMAATDSPEELAWYLAAADRMIGNFLEGFSTGGYCSEGLGYWGYGFGNFIVMTEYLRRITGGELDLFARKEAQAAAGFPFGIEIVDGVYPAYADCVIDETLLYTWSWYVSKRLGYTIPDNVVVEHPSSNGFSIYGRIPFIDPSEVPVFEGDFTPGDPLRTYYPEAGVLVTRKPGDAASGVAIKAGHNEEHHNHNDIGSFVVVANGVPILCDPGKEQYTRDTFSDKRYESFVHNSYGHDVPVVAGELQGTGVDYRGVITFAEFGENRDRVEIDLTRAYAVPELVSLTRTLEFDRTAGTVTVVDAVEFSEPRSFETALISYGTFEFTDQGFNVVDGNGEAKLKVSSKGSSLTYSQEVLHAKWQSRTRDGAIPRRFGIECVEPVTEASITCVISLPIQ